MQNEDEEVLPAAESEKKVETILEAEIGRVLGAKLKENEKNGIKKEIRGMKASIIFEDVTQKDAQAITGDMTAKKAVSVSFDGEDVAWLGGGIGSIDVIKNDFGGLKEIRLTSKDGLTSATFSLEFSKNTFNIGVSTTTTTPARKSMQEEPQDSLIKR